MKEEQSLKNDPRYIAPPNPEWNNPHYPLTFWGLLLPPFIVMGVIIIIVAIFSN